MTACGGNFIGDEIRPAMKSGETSNVRMKRTCDD